MFKYPEKYRFSTKSFPSNANEPGSFLLRFKDKKKKEWVNLLCIASDSYGWEHVSVSLINECPRWDHMCYVKDHFWDPEDVVIQYHPKKSEYVNTMKYCLHLWRPINLEISTPPPVLVGIVNSIYKKRKD